LTFLRTLATPEPIKDWSLTSLKEKLIKIGAKVVSHGRYIAFQMAEVAIPRQTFQEILRLIAELRPQPPPAPCVQEQPRGGVRPKCQGKRTPFGLVRRHGDGALLELDDAMASSELQRGEHRVEADPIARGTRTGDLG
jgi:hypothetical protein